MTTWTCESSGLEVENETLPTGWLYMRFEQDNGVVTEHVVCSMWQAADLCNKLANLGNY